MKNRIRQLRQEKGLTLVELSNNLKNDYNEKISADLLAKYEREDREPKIETWIKLAKYFDVSFPYLMGIKDSQNNVESLLSETLMTPDDLAERLETDKETIEDYIDGEEIPRNALIKMSHIFRVQPDYIVGLTANRNYEFRAPNDTGSTSFAVYKDTDEYNAIYAHLLGSSLTFLRDKYPHLRDDDMHDIASNITQTNIEFLWETYVKDDTKRPGLKNTNSAKSTDGKETN